MLECEVDEARADRGVLVCSRILGWRIAFFVKSSRLSLGSDCERVAPASDAISLGAAAVAVAVAFEGGL